MAKDRTDRHTDVGAFLNALYNLKHYEEALAAYEQALRLDHVPLGQAPNAKI